MTSSAIPFRLSPECLHAQLAGFNARDEIEWFGFEGAFVAPGSASISFGRLRQGALGGGGVAAINGGVIAAGFDAAFVLAGLGHYETEVVVTLDLSVKFLSLARADTPMAFRAHAVRSARSFCFVEGALVSLQDTAGAAFAMATGMVAPVYRT